MSNDLHIAVFQMDIVWEQPKSNLGKISRLQEDLSGVDVLILPEMCTTGFSMNARENAEPHPPESLNFLLDFSINTGTALIFSLIVQEGDAYYNRLYFTRPDGTYAEYDKKHLFSMGGEHTHYTPGKSRLVVEYKGWKICPLVCYDLRFPVWSRNDVYYELLVYVANWPAVRREVWQKLLPARAIENQAYVVGVNRVGKDGQGLDYTGDSLIIDPKGKIQNAPPENREILAKERLSHSELQRFREKFAVLEDRDKFKME